VPLPRPISIHCRVPVIGHGGLPPEIFKAVYGKRDEPRSGIAVRIVVAHFSLVEFEMPDEEDARDLRKRATRYRQMALTINDQRTADALLDMARECEELADWLEAGKPLEE
jgi:hypothetical protein